jgi:hypothetical protein
MYYLNWCAEFEKNFDPDPIYYWMRENSWVPVVAVLLCKNITVNSF